MAYTENRNGKYRVRYIDSLGIKHSKTFTRKTDADRFQRETEVDMERGSWLDPKGAELTVLAWS